MLHVRKLLLSLRHACLVVLFLARLEHAAGAFLNDVVSNPGILVIFVPLNDLYLLLLLL